VSSKTLRVPKRDVEGEASKDPVGGGRVFLLDRPAAVRGRDDSRVALRVRYTEHFEPARVFFGCVPDNVLCFDISLWLIALGEIN
jgi:hypothetical protein